MWCDIDRRLFLKYGLTSAATLCLGCTANATGCGQQSQLHEARFYEKTKGKGVRCRLCFRGCTIAEGARGFCRNRENREGVLYSLVYARPAALQLDPIEKEPMYHNLPGSGILGTGTASCNFRCRFCHNWHLSQKTIEELEPYVLDIAPEGIVNEAVDNEVGLSFTYNEPTVFYEFMYDVARLGHERGLNTIFHTNGGMRAAPLRAILAHMDGVTVDLKGFTADYYRDVSFARMTPVLETLERIKESGKWLEIVNLLVPTLNDDMVVIEEMCAWIRTNLGADVPVHFNRFSPAYRMKHLPPTPVKKLEQAHEIAIAEGIKFVYIGNVPGHKHNSTYCPKCGERIIHRTHFFVHSVELEAGKCRFCGEPIPGRWIT